MNVLQAAFGVVRGLDAQQLLHALVPLLRQLLHRHVLLKQRELQLKAQHDVQAIAQLIGFYADQAGFERV
jgi:hypothetical protein